MSARISVRSPDPPPPAASKAASLILIAFNSTVKAVNFSKVSCSNSKSNSFISAA
jgi:hypothetical protein